MVTCWNTTAKKTDFLQRSLWVNLSNTNIMDNCVLTECRSSHEVIDGLSIDWKSALAVGHHDSNSSSTPHFSTKIGLSWFAKLALPAFCLITRYNMVSRLHLSHTFTNTFHYTAFFSHEKNKENEHRTNVLIKDFMIQNEHVPSSFMTKDTWEETFRILQREKTLCLR